MIQAWQVDRLRASHEVAGTLKLVTAPASEPVTIEEAKAHCNVTSSDDDGLITDYITAARTLLEARTHRAFINTVFDYAFVWFPCGSAPLILPVAPLVSVTSVTSYSSADAATAMSSSTYLVDTFSEPGQIAPNTNVTWPADGLRLTNAGIVRFTAGYGTDAESVPAPLRHAMKLLIGHWYRQREPIAVGSLVAEIGWTVDALIAPYILTRA